MTITTLKPPPKLKRNYSLKDISGDKSKLLGVSLRLPVACNLKCNYCYASPSNNAFDLYHDDIISFLDQSISLGIRSVSIVGEGEPLLYKLQTSKNSSKTADIFELIDYLNKSNVQVILYTNATLIDKKIANKLFSKDLVVVAKENGPSSTIQDKISGVGSYKKIQAGINELKLAGFNKDQDNHRLSMHTVILKSNYEEIPKLWKKWRSENILPQAQIAVSKNKEDIVSSSDLKKLFYKLRDIDQQNFGFTWEPRPPIAPHGCNVFYSSCALRPSGEISICAYTNHILGNIKNEKLKDILDKKETKKLSNISQYINKGVCSKCNLQQLYKCYGCRAHQYETSNNLFDSYSYCWKNDFNSN